MKIWTTGYNAWVMGGSPHYILETDVPQVKGPFDLGKGFQGYLFTAPSGKTFVTEATSAAIVGPTIEKVRGDIAACEDMAMMQGQVDSAKKLYGSRRKEIVEPAEFWKRMKAL